MTKTISNIRATDTSPHESRGTEKKIKYLSVCSGIEAASVAWVPLGWKPVAFAEIEAFPCAVLAHHYPDVPNLGDMTQIDGGAYRGTVDLVVGGTPCQGFSIAGLRGGMADPRSGLARSYADLVGAVQPRWIVWENVPGVLSSGKGRDFGAFIRQLAELGYGVSWRVLDAQFFGVPQRRRRVFVVGHLGDWRPAAAVLFEPHSLRGGSAPSGETGTHITQALTGSLGAGGADDNKAQGGFIISQYGDKAAALTSEGADASPCADRGPTIVAQYAPSRASTVTARNPSRGADCDFTSTHVVCALHNFRKDDAPVMVALHPRRMTPLECERLQGFPDHYTRIAWRGHPVEKCPDGPRYKAVGNAMAVPVMRWIGARIDRANSGNAEYGRNLR